MFTVKMFSAIFIAALVTATLTAGEIKEGVHNGTFEEGVDPSLERPRWWFVGDEVSLPDGDGEWALVHDSERNSEVLQLNPESQEDGFFVSQFPDIPLGNRVGSTFVFRASIRNGLADGLAMALFVAVSPDAPIDPELGVPVAGKVMFTSDSGEWEDLEGSFTLAEDARLWLMLLAQGVDGSVRFDDISVTVDLPLPECGEDVNTFPGLEGGPPSFPLGIVNESPGNESEYARSKLVTEAAEIADTVNLFIHVRWNGLTGEDLLTGHRIVLREGDELKRRHMERMVTFDFTHNSLDGIGSINPLPDGTLVGRLDTPGVMDAYLAELTAIVEKVQPTIVSVGIEVDFFLEKHPDQWGDYRTMLCRAHNDLKQIIPDLHVTTYVTLPSLLSMDGVIDQGVADAIRALRPCIDSVGYSTYPAMEGLHLDDYPPGFFNAASAVAPDLPLIIPEFGYRGDGLYPEEEQEDFLRRIISELSGYDTTAMYLYSLYDQTYLGVNPWFREAFSTIGLKKLDRSPKRIYTLLERIHRSRPHARPFTGPPAPCRE